MSSIVVFDVDDRMGIYYGPEPTKSFFTTSQTTCQMSSIMLFDVDGEMDVCYGLPGQHSAPTPDGGTSPLPSDRTWAVRPYPE
jgi:hypothetical protein